MIISHLQDGVAQLLTNPAEVKQFEVNWTVVGGRQSADELSWKRSSGFHFLLQPLRGSRGRVGFIHP